MSRPTLFLTRQSQMYRPITVRGKAVEPAGRPALGLLFVTMLRKLITDHHPAYIAASFDLAGPTFRDKLVADYKANRAAMPDDLAEQINWVHEACEALGVPIVTSPGYEADDVIGTMATRAAEAGFEVAIVSIDKDFFQLVRTAFACTTPARTARGSTSGGRRIRRRPLACRRRAGARGDTSDKHFRSAWSERRGHRPIARTAAWTPCSTGGRADP